MRASDGFRTRPGAPLRPLPSCRGVRKRSASDPGGARLGRGSLCAAVRGPGTGKRKGGAGFTLIEILVAILILGVVMTTVYASYFGTFRVIRATEEDAAAYGIARTVMDRVIKDLSAAAPWGGEFLFQTWEQSLGRETVVQLRFRSTAHLAFGEEEAPEGVALIGYRLAEGTDQQGYTLWRSDSLVGGLSREAEAAGGFLLGERIQALTWRFFDEEGQSYDRWDSTGGIEGQQGKAPAAVALELQLLGEGGQERPYRFATRVQLPMQHPEVP